MFDPISLDLAKLFRAPSMFDSRDSFRDAGFEVFDRSHDNHSKIMVGRHQSAKGYLFKKYSNDVSLKEQLENYERRIEGVQKLRAFVDDQRLRHVAVPQKWLYELPREFSRRKKSHVLVVERLKILDDDASKREYAHIDKNILRELCEVVFTFRGLDSNSKNIPFTEDGQLAFIDTEHWNRHSKRDRESRTRHVRDRQPHESARKPYLRHIYEYLSSERRDRAEKIFDELEG